MQCSACSYSNFLRPSFALSHLSFVEFLLLLLQIESGCKVFKLNDLHVSLVKPLPPGAKFCFKMHLPDTFNDKKLVAISLVITDLHGHC